MIMNDNEDELDSSEICDVTVKVNRNQNRLRRSDAFSAYPASMLKRYTLTTKHFSLRAAYNIFFDSTTQVKKFSESQCRSAAHLSGDRPTDTTRVVLEPTSIRADIKPRIKPI